MFDELCPSSLVPVRMDAKWAPLVLRCLETGPRRFSELRVPLHRASAKELSRTLRVLQRDGFVIRAAHGRAVSYTLTPLGSGLLGQLDAFCAWTAEYWDDLLDARDPAA
jgi:DNA-binding HxlR family transcriptional regulator